MFVPSAILSFPTIVVQTASSSSNQTSNTIVTEFLNFSH